MPNLLRRVLAYRKQFIDMVAGMPNYEKYVEHMEAEHSGEPIKSRKQFFCEAQEAKYDAKDGKVSRCC